MLLNTPPNKKQMNGRLLEESSQKLVESADEELCRHAQHGCMVSRNLLWHRHSGFIRSIVCQQSIYHRLPQNEFPDALQEMYFAFYQAIGNYHPEDHAHKKPASFKTFLKLVITRKLSSYCACRRNYYKHMTTPLDHEQLGAHMAEDCGNGHCVSGRWQELSCNDLASETLAEVLRGLKCKEKNLLTTWLACGRDREVAQALGISPAAAKLRRERLFRKLKKHLLVQ